MKKILLAMAACVCSMSINAQEIKVYKGGNIIKTYAASEADSVVFAEATPTPTPTVAPLLPGKFTVNAEGKQVQFTKSNIYWDGSDFHFEDKQTDYPIIWNASHISHFFWTNSTNYQNKTDMPYEEQYPLNIETVSGNDQLWCGEGNKITVDGTTGLYALSSNECYYLIYTRKDVNQNNLYCSGVKVTDGLNILAENCLIIAPDGYTNTEKPLISTAEYTITEINTLGLVCLPAAGYRNGTTISYNGVSGNYWNNTPNDKEKASGLCFSSNDVLAANTDLNRSTGSAIRLVK